jgi:hypothetical protein
MRKEVLIACLACLVIGFGIGFLIFHQKNQKNQFVDLPQKEKAQFFLRTLGGDIGVIQAKRQMEAFIYKRDHGQLNSTNLPIATVFTSKEIISFLVRAYGYDRSPMNIDPSLIPDNEGVAFIVGISEQTDDRAGRSTCMIASTKFTTSNPDRGRVVLDNRIINSGSSTQTFVYDIGHTYP